MKDGERGKRGEPKNNEVLWRVEEEEGGRGRGRPPEGGVWKPPKLADILCEQPLTNQEPMLHHDRGNSLTPLLSEGTTRVSR